VLRRTEVPKWDGFMVKYEESGARADAKYCFSEGRGGEARRIPVTRWCGGLFASLGRNEVKMCRDDSPAASLCMGQNKTGRFGRSPVGWPDLGQRTRK